MTAQRFRARRARSDNGIIGKGETYSNDHNRFVPLDSGTDMPIVVQRVVPLPSPRPTPGS